MVVAAVAAGALAAGAQSLEPPPELTEDSVLLALGETGTTAYTGLTSRPPTTVTLPRPEVLPVSPASRAQDMTSLAKGQRIADEQAAAEAAAAERAAAAQAEAAAEAERAAARAEAERAAAEAEEADLASSRQVQVAAGEVVLPAVGELTSGFGARWGSTHYGIDIANSIGTPIYATTDGVVVESGPASGFGMWVRIEHTDGTISVYGHINESLVSAGEQVVAGEQIATMGNRGQSTGPHLHFEIWLASGEKVDPLNWLRTNGVDI